jgi:hypothetical protein
VSEETDRYYAEGYEAGSMELHKWVRRAERADARIAQLEAELAKVYKLNDYNSLERQKAWARIERLEAALRDVMPRATFTGYEQEQAHLRYRALLGAASETSTEQPKSIHVDDDMHRSAANRGTKP